MVRVLLACSIVAFVSAGCLIGDISLEGKSCPCAEPAVCDFTRNICVLPELLPDAGAVDADLSDRGEIDSGGLDEDAGAEDVESLDAEDVGPVDAEDVGIEDVGPIDVGPAEDTGPSDVGPGDTGMIDTGVPDIGAPDTGPRDTGPVDTGLPDTGPPDTGPVDTGPRDTGVADTGPPDTGPPDTGPPDTGPPDTGPPDTGPPDTGPPDTGTPDAGFPDAAAPGSLPLGASCMSDVECSTEHCLEVSNGGSMFHVCVRGCSSTSDCPLDFSCREVRWATYCLPESVFVPAEQFDTPSGGMCLISSESCQSGLCNTTTLTCTERCMRESDCASFGGVCAHYNTDHRSVCEVRGTVAIGVACSTDGDCQTGICNRVTSLCAAHCCSESDCPVSETCDGYNTGGSAISKICRPQRAMPGVLGYGAACFNHGDCESEACASLTPGVTFPKQCSTTCCEDSDCAIIPGGGRCHPFDYPIPGSQIGYCVAP